MIYESRIARHIPETEVRTMVLPDGRADISCELEKMEKLAANLQRQLFDLQSSKPDNTEEKERINSLYWIAATINETAIQAHAEC